MSSRKRSRCSSTRDASKNKLSNDEKENVTIRRRIKSVDTKGEVITQNVKNNGMVSSGNNIQISISSNAIARRKPFAILQEETGISNMQISVSNCNDKLTSSSTTTATITIAKTTSTKETTSEVTNEKTQISIKTNNDQKSFSTSQIRKTNECTKNACDSRKSTTINIITIDSKTITSDSKELRDSDHELQKNNVYNFDNRHMPKNAGEEKAKCNEESHVGIISKEELCAVESNASDCKHICNNTNRNQLPNLTVNKTPPVSAGASPISSPPIIIDRTNITVRRSLTPGLLQQNDSDSDEIFFESNTHIYFQASKPVNSQKSLENGIHVGTHIQPIRGGFMSPIKPNIFTKPTTLILQDFPHKPAQKKTLAHRMPQNKKILSDASSGYLDLYTSEYLEDIIKYSLENDRKYILKKVNNKAVFLNSRELLVNWLHKVQNYFKLPTSVILITVRLFDGILANAKVPINMFQLLGLSILWVVDKFESNCIAISSNKLLRLCGGAYTIQQLLKMEHKVLKFSNFDFNIPDPTLYVSYYMKYLDKLDDKLRNCAYHLLESFTLAPEYSTITPSIQAAAAFYLSSKIYNEDLWLQLGTCLVFYKFDDFKLVCESMTSQIRKISSNSSKYSAFFEKNRVIDLGLISKYDRRNFN